MTAGFDVALAREVVSRYGPRLNVAAAHGSLVGAAAARVEQLNLLMGNLLREVREAEAEQIALHQLALWAQRSATADELADVTHLADIF